MGLDMYLTAKRYLWQGRAESNAIGKAIREALNVPAEFRPVGYMRMEDEDDAIAKEVTVNVGYWRKANAIHGWFVNNVQGGEDECRPHEVSAEQLEQLRVAVQGALDAHDTMTEEGAKEVAMRLLPPCKGFFFGSSDIDEWYWGDLRTTLQIIDAAKLLMGDDGNGWTLYYRSSW
jgi:hypothetical protein